MRLLEDLTGGPVSFAEMIRTIRECEEMSLDTFARRLGVSRRVLGDTEKGRRVASAEVAARWALLLGYPEWQFVQLALQSQIDAAGLKYDVELTSVAPIRRARGDQHDAQGGCH